MEYHFQDGDTKTPAAFLSRLMTQNASTTTASPSTAGTVVLTSAATPSVIPGSAVVQTLMVFNFSSLVPTENMVINATQSLLSARLSNLTDAVTVLNFTYAKISDTTFAVNFTFLISNISIPVNTSLTNDTYKEVQRIVNKNLNTLLNNPDAASFEPKNSFFVSSGNQVNGSMEYHFQDGDTKTPAAFLDKITPIFRLGNVLIYIQLLFMNLTKVPSEADVLTAANAFLNSNIRTARDLTSQQLNDPVSIQNITYQIIDNKSYIIGFGFRISNVSIYKDSQLRNETYDLIQNTVNSLLNTILNAKGTFVFPRANYTYDGTEIVANSEYIFVEGVTQFTPSRFLFEILKISGLAISTTPAAQTDAPIYVVLRPTVQANTTTTGGSSAWILGIIIPCSIVIILIPCWILLCCLLCGCCAGLRRRYNRRVRQSYNVEYRTHNRLHF
ncbi:uncharacterized protein LOC124399711 [Silurus meridionalis]|uniref:uncharacterized protein LOC124399711 n=1 Tax=Silurus meridionalis TaxID=175797 RepID=UPI001EEBA462|nr:uncharacterized protein LOC124399711 [Silurus meridionalis]